MLLGETVGGLRGSLLPWCKRLWTRDLCSMVPQILGGSSFLPITRDCGATGVLTMVSYTLQVLTVDEEISRREIYCDWSAPSANKRASEDPITQSTVTMINAITLSCPCRVKRWLRPAPHLEGHDYT